MPIRDDKTTRSLAHRTEENLTPAMKDDRDKFAREYLRDFSQRNAGLRMGWNPKHVDKKASNMIREPYVQQRIAEMRERLDEDSIVTRAEVLWGLKREAYFDDPLLSSHAARVAAWSKLGKLLGMEVDQLKIDATFRGGVMVVPMPTNEAQWEQMSVNAQKMLKDDVRA